MVLVLNLETILAILSAIPFSSFRALLSCGFVCCILLSGFAFNEVRIKSSDIVLLYEFLSQCRHYRGTIANFFGLIKK